MLRQLSPAPLLFLLAATPALAQDAPPSPWVMDFDAGVAAAKEHDKDLFVQFVGSNWCEFSKELHRKVTSDARWLKSAQAHYVLVTLDFPEGAEAVALVPDPARNAEVADLYGVVDSPTVLLMAADGEVYGMLGYEAGGADAYWKRIEQLQTVGKQFNRDVAELRTTLASQEDVVPLVQRSIQLLNIAVPGVQHLAQVADWARRVYVLDTEQHSALKVRAMRSILEAGQGTLQDVPVARRLDADNATGLVERATLAGFDSIRSEQGANEWIDFMLKLAAVPKLHQPAEVQSVAVHAAVFCFEHLDRKQDAAKLAAWVKSLGPVPDEFVDTIEAML